MVIIFIVHSPIYISSTTKNLKTFENGKTRHNSSKTWHLEADGLFNIEPIILYFVLNRGEKKLKCEYDCFMYQKI